MKVIDLLVKLKTDFSKSHLRRLCKQGGIRFYYDELSLKWMYAFGIEVELDNKGGEKKFDPDEEMRVTPDMIKIGKKDFISIELPHKAELVSEDDEHILMKIVKK